MFKHRVRVWIHLTLRYAHKHAHVNKALLTCGYSCHLACETISSVIRGPLLWVTASIISDVQSAVTVLKAWSGFLRSYCIQSHSNMELIPNKASTGESRTATALHSLPAWCKSMWRFPLAENVLMILECWGQGGSLRHNEELSILFKNKQTNRTAEHVTGQCYCIIKHKSQS